MNEQRQNPISFSKIANQGQLLVCISFVFALVFLAAPALARTEDQGEGCKALFLMDGASGYIIEEQNAHQPMPPASMVKMMTAYLAMKRIEDGVAELSDVIEVSAAASKIGGSQVYLKHKETFTLEELIQAVMIQSANDASYAIAEHFGGSSPGFVDMMNAEAEELGLKETTFRSPHGLPPSRGQEPDMVSAHDLALLAKALIDKFPQLLEMSKTQEAPFRDGSFQMRNTNHLLKRFKGSDGLKTGYYRKAGFCITATAERKGARMIAVVMGCKNGRKRFEEAARLLSLGFSKYKVVELIEQGTSAAGKITVKNGIDKAIVPIAAETLTASVMTGQADEVIKQEKLFPQLQAPVASGTKCGTISFHIGERKVGEVDLIAGKPVAKLDLLGKAARFLKLK